MELPIQIEENALLAIQKIITQKQIPSEYALRVGTKGNSCSKAHHFLLGFDKPKEMDLIFDLPDISILIDKRQLMYVIGLELVYEHDDKGNWGFTFKNSIIKKE